MPMWSVNKLINSTSPPQVITANMSLWALGNQAILGEPPPHGCCWPLQRRQMSKPAGLLRERWLRTHMTPRCPDAHIHT